MFTENLSEKQKELLRKRLDKDQSLLDSIKAKLPSLEELVFLFNFEYEDGVYRFYHNLFKVYNLQDLTVKAVDVSRTSPKRQIPTSANGSSRSSSPALPKNGTVITIVSGCFKRDLWLRLFYTRNIFLT